MIIGGFPKFRAALATFLGTLTLSQTPASISQTNTIVLKVEADSELRLVVSPTQVPLEPGTRTSPRHNWRCNIHVFQTLDEVDAAAEMARQDELMTYVDEISQAVTAARELEINGRSYSVRLPSDTPRASMDEQAMAQHGMFWASVEVELVD